MMQLQPAGDDRLVAACVRASSKLTAGLQRCVFPECKRRQTLPDDGRLGGIKEMVVMV